MERKPPAPLCKAFLACRQIIQDMASKEFVLLGPTHQFHAPVFPMIAGLSFFAQCTSVQGAYHLELQLQDLDGNAQWRHAFEPPWECNDPLNVAYLTLQNLGIYFPRPGKY
ncbi:MAG TPA: hypothetical protein VFE56_05230, partial [Candidatus Binataceae bacterium]|nr:hypothetical protein [Candidatus Binataceae bacterium]